MASRNQDFPYCDNHVELVASENDVTGNNAIPSYGVGYCYNFADRARHRKYCA